jgi:hypothetical protein
LLNDLGMSDSDLKDASPSVRDLILKGFAKIKGLEMVRTIQLFDRDSKRLDDKSRAVREQQGLKMSKKKADDETVLGDKITQSFGGLVALGTAAVMAGAGWMIWPTSTPPKPLPVQPPAVVQPQPAEPLLREVEILFYDGKGNEIYIPHISTRPASEP